MEGSVESSRLTPQENLTAQSFVRFALLHQAWAYRHKSSESVLIKGWRSQGMLAIVPGPRIRELRFFHIQELL